MNYRVLALDLDGTTLTSDHRILPPVREAIASIRDRATVLLVTGRHHTAARPYHHELGLSTPIICCNGTYVYDYRTESVLAADAIGHDVARDFLALAAGHGLNLVMYVTDRMVYSASRPIDYMQVLERWAQQFPATIRPSIARVASFDDELASQSHVWKFVVEGDIDGVEAFARLPWVQEHFNGEKSWRNRIDFARRGNTKGSRLAAFLAQHAIDPAEVVAIGDNHNDISMLQLAGLGVAMANADDAVKQAADVVTEETNDGLGIREVLHRYFGA
ncbi:Cof-type HAD-IIB family hydrolase [Musicola paradisiaca]|uniref:Cof-like hydrolase n=1 Tax=Musicola paradisiaca (strain Ech703) TaxID=579405 RepID=C6C6M0_MUSP7|nr:Cof-type HAD-IIB family hydrolase [Musicola paradisiaca]ACS83939.1 Cof-like hydrolase [Musicola paradisiaca Ech703]